MMYTLIEYSVRLHYMKTAYVLFCFVCSVVFFYPKYKSMFVGSMSISVNPFQGRQPVLLQSPSLVLDRITPSEDLNSQSTTYLLRMHALLLWNEFCTSASYRNNHALGILLSWSSVICYITVWLTSWLLEGRLSC